MELGKDITFGVLKSSKAGIPTIQICSLGYKRKD